MQTYLNNYQKNQPMPDAETEWQLDSMLIKMLNVDAVNAFAKQTILPTNQVIVINAPEKEGVATPTAEEILAIRDKVAASEVTAYEDNVVKEPLIAEGTVLKGSPVKKTVEDKQLGTTEWTLANGAKVVVKPTTFKADEVRLGVVGKGGLSLLSDEEYYMGEMMPAVNSMSGVGKFSATELKKQLSGKTASVQPSVENYTSAMGGVCSPKDIETMLQLLYLNFTQPRFNKDDVDNLTKMLLAQLANAKSNPDFLMQEKVADVTYGHNQVRLRTAARHLRQALPRSQRIRLHVRGQHRPRNAETPRGEIHRFDPRRPQTDQLRRRQGLSGERRGYGGVHGSDAAAEGLGQLPFLG